MLNHEIIGLTNLDISNKFPQYYERFGDFVSKCSLKQRDCLITYSFFIFKNAKS